jgi:hypothetical protein
MVEALQEQRGIMQRPTMDGRVIDRDAALSHHLLEISQAQVIGEIPPDAEQNHRSIKMPALEHAALRP